MAKKKAAARKSVLPPVNQAGLPGEIVGEMNGFKIRRVKVSDIIPADYNPREMTESAGEGLKESMNEFGLVQPLVWNKRFARLVGGHQRHKKLDPNATTDVVEVDLDVIREKALNLSLNNPAIQGTWTEEKLKAALDEIGEDAPELATRLALDDLVPETLDDVPSGGAGDDNLDDLPDGNEDLDTEHTCPKCGHQF